MGANFEWPAPKNLREQKIVQNIARFLATFDFDREYLRIGSTLSKIGKALENLQPLPRWKKKSLCTSVHKRQSLFP